MELVVGLADVPPDVRAQIAGAIRQQAEGLIEDVAMIVAHRGGLDAAGWRTFSRVLVDLLALAIEEGRIDERRGRIYDLAHLTPAVSLRQLIDVRIDDCVKSMTRQVVESLRPNSGCQVDACVCSVPPPTEKRTLRCSGNLKSRAPLSPPL